MGCKIQFSATLFSKIADEQVGRALQDNLIERETFFAQGLNAFGEFC
ncbi:MAG: hypothetical protein IT425_04380 [Pirellulales bacterium]|nr:hypothetical protein [Pirellulales bacterium]